MRLTHDGNKGKWAGDGNKGKGAGDGNKGKGTGDGNKGKVTGDENNGSIILIICMATGHVQYGYSTELNQRGEEGRGRFPSWAPL